MNITPVINEPALIIEVKRKKILCIADLHLGYEMELRKRGFKLPSQSQKLLMKLENIVTRTKPDKLLILGDVKHNLLGISRREIDELNSFFTNITREIDIEIIKGNHDGDIENAEIPNVKIVSSKGITINFGSKKVGFFHGHAWPEPTVLDSNYLIVAHSHPSVEFRDPLGYRYFEPVWIRGTINKNIVAEAYLKSQGIKKYTSPLEKFKELYGLNLKPSKIFVMPAFNMLISGTPVNLEKEPPLIGPLFKSGAININNMDAYLLDGVFLGKVNAIKKFPAPL
ncbi:MAG: metallophosphoesterase [Candidatus Odinarchaeia archaeon]